jgi:hypothetical protein
MYFLYIAIVLIGYFFLEYSIKTWIYNKDAKKRKITILNIRIVAISSILNFILEYFGIHNKWLFDFVIGFSAFSVLYNLGIWFIFKKYASSKDSNFLIKEDDENYEDVNNHIKSKNISGEFNFQGKKFLSQNDKIWEIKKTYKSNKETRLYDMFFVLILFFASLLYLAVILDGIISKDSMAYAVVLLFGAAFILPFLQDVKYTIRFARNPHLSFDSFVSIWINGKEIFGKITDMNTYEIILFRRFSKDYVTISHSEIKTFTTYEQGKRFSKLYVVSKDIKYQLNEELPVWLECFNEAFDNCLDLDSLELFFTTEDDDHGIELNVFIKQDFLGTYSLIIKQIEDYIQRKSDENEWSLETPKRHDIKIISDENEIKTNNKKGEKIPN